MNPKWIFWNGEEERVRAGWRMLLQLVMLVALLWVGQFALDRLLAAFIPNPTNAGVATIEVASFAVQLLSQVTIVASVWLAGRWLDRRPFRDFGFHFNSRWWGDFAFGLALGAALMAAVFLVEWAAGWVEVTGFFVTHEGGLPFLPGIALPLIGYVAVGIAEEVWTRGYILTNLAESFNGRRLGSAAAIAIATVIQGAVFGLLHAGNPNATVVSTFDLFLAAFLLALGYILTGELAIPIGLHITWNFVQGNVFGFPVSGGRYSVGTFIRVEQAGPALWTGGPFGPEAGLIGIGALLLGCVSILLWVRLRDGSVTLAKEIAQPPHSPRTEELG